LLKVALNIETLPLIWVTSGLSFEAGCRRNSTSTLYYFLCIKDKKCVIYSISRYRDNNLGFFPLPIAYYRHDY
jgi:hypothetical protein